VQGGVAEVWKDNLFNELAKEESEVESVDWLFTKIRNNFGETLKKEKKIEQLRTIEQGGRTCNEYVQEFKKVARGSSYEGHPLIEEFKRGLNGAIRRKLAETEEPPVKNGIPEERKYGIVDRNYTLFRSNVQRRRGMYLAIRERRLWRRDKDVGAESDLLNDLGFNLYVAPQSLVMRLVAYFGVEEVAKTEIPKSQVKESEWTRWD